MKKIPQIVTAEEGHIRQIAAAMRNPDVEELASLGYTPAMAMVLSFETAAAAWTGLIDGVPVCMFGVSPSPDTPEVGNPWMMGTTQLDANAALFLRRCRPQVKRMLALYPILENWVGAANKTAVKWLEWLGFEMIESRPYGIDGEIFINFRMEAPVQKDLTMESKHLTEKAQAKNELAKKDIFQKGIEDAESVMFQCEQIHVEPEHRFAEGLYARTLTMPKDSVFSSRVHLHENYAFVMKGSCLVVSEDGIEEIHAPHIIKTKRGTKRLLRILEECTWVTVHAIPPELGEDIEKIEAYLAVGTLQEYNQLEQQKAVEVTQ